MRSPVAIGQTVALRLVLAPGPLAPWVSDCVRTLEQDLGFAVRCWRPGEPVATGEGRVVLLALDEAAARLLPEAGPASHHWVLSDAQGRPLSTAWPLLAQITGRQGVALQLLERSTLGEGAWQCRRRGHWSAPARYLRAMSALVDAVQQLLQSARVDWLGGVPPQPARWPGGASGNGASPAAGQLGLPWAGALSPVQRGLALLAGRARAWWTHQRARWLSEYWRIGIVDAPALAWVRSGGRLPVRWLDSPTDAGYWADPMGMVGDAHQLFCEYFNEHTGQGHLEALNLGPDGQVVSCSRLPVGGGAHVSFPLVMEIDGRRLGVAEAAATKECLLYEVDASGAWRPVGTLLRNVSAADPALFVWEGRYWLAFTDLAIGAGDNLCLYHADGLDGPWLPHANNPVKLDATGARMAGGFFKSDGALYRPAQDCLRSYGAALAVHRVVRCTPTEYVEEEVARIQPAADGPCPDGLHTLSAWGNRTLIDGKRVGFNPVALRRKLFERLGWWPTGMRSHGQDGGVQRVAVYIPHLRLGGGETSLLRLASGLARQGLQVDLVVHTMDTAELQVPDSVQLMCLDARGTASALRRLAKLIRNRRPDVLLSGFPHTNIAAVAAVALSGVACHCVVSEHAPLSRQISQQGGWRYRLLPPLVRWAYRRAGAVVAVSSGVRDDLSKVLGLQRSIHVIANPVLADGGDSAHASEALHPWLLDPALQVVLSVSRLSVEKDIPTLLAAFAQVHQGRPSTRLVLAGDGPERVHLQTLVQTLGLQAVVALPGRVAQPMAWMRQARVFALASQYEGFGNVLVEALASGVPVVSTDCPVGPSEILDGGRYGRLVPVGDSQAMAQAIAQCLEAGGPPEGAQAHAQQFTESRSCAAYRDVFDQRPKAVTC